MTIQRLRVLWEGAGVVGPSVSTFYFSDGDIGFVADVGNFFTALVALIPNDVSIVVPSAGDAINEVNGAITGSWTDGNDVVVLGTSSSSFALGTGVRVIWETNGIVAGRHVRGSTFLVPLSVSAFDTFGRTSAAAVTTINNAADAFLGQAASQPVVWSRPIPGRAGTVHDILSARTSSIPTSLRSRRY